MPIAIRPLLATALALTLALTLTACGSARVGGIFEEQDGAPDHHIDVAMIQDAEPKVEPRARYGNPESYVVFGKRYYPMKSAKGYKERGIASWYGTKFHGRKTSSGEPYDLAKMTAAHKTLPLPTYAKVTNLKNGRSVIVKVNDRGPFHENRIIDLSYAAALKLGTKATGTGFVEVEAIDPTTWGRDAPATTVATPAPLPTAPIQATPVAPAQRETTPASARFYLQLGAFSSRANAEQLARRVRADGHGATEVSEIQTANALLYRVRLGPLASAAEAERLASQMGPYGISNPRVIPD